MNKFVVQVTLGQKNTGGQKAKEDVNTILKEEHFKSLKIEIVRNKLIKLITIPYKVKRSLKAITNDDIVVVQYPMYSGMLIKSIIKECKRKKAKVIIIIHDLEALRLNKNMKHKNKEENFILNSCDCIVSHNNKMTDWLREHGVLTKTVSLDIFDYIGTFKNVAGGVKKDLVFAGNLEKSKFLSKWKLKSRLNLFGINPSDNYYSTVNYMGVKSPEELPKFLDGSFGIVWDGSSMKTNTGIYGEYTKYNNPHKLSLYLSCGLPVIVWKEAAIAQFVETHKVGIVVDSLFEVDTIMKKISTLEYNEIKKNVDNLSDSLKHGYYTKTAIKGAINSVLE